MITVTMQYANGRPCGFSASGHAGYAESGQDIVCSAVSALTETCVIGITEVLHVDAGVSVDDEAGITLVLDRDMAEDVSEKAELLLETMEAGLEGIRRAYPKYLKIRHREV